MSHVLIICIGNDARGDDGVAHHVAQMLSCADSDARESAAHLADPATLPDCRVMTATDLDVAMSQDVADASYLIVVDSERREAPAVEVRDLLAGAGSHSGHSVDAPGLLAITSAIYGAAPPGVLVSVAAPEMSHSQELSPTAKAASEEAARVVRSICSEHC